MFGKGVLNNTFHCCLGVHQLCCQGFVHNPWHVENVWFGFGTEKIDQLLYLFLRIIMLIQVRKTPYFYAILIMKKNQTNKKIKSLILQDILDISKILFAIYHFNQFHFLFQSLYFSLLVFPLFKELFPLFDYFFFFLFKFVFQLLLYFFSVCFL